MDTSGAVWEQLAGKRIILAGIDSQQKQRFQQSLVDKCSQMGEAFAVSEGLETAGEDDHVFLFSSMERAEELDLLLGQLKLLSQKRVASAVLVSDNRVYGKLFGTAHRLTEQELGYACHTDANDRIVTNMRLAEHLAYRMAGEGVPIRIVRMDAVQAGMLEAAVKVLLKGISGEVYNLPAMAEAGTERSPLSPIGVMTDTSKVETININ